MIPNRTLLAGLAFGLAVSHLATAHPEGHQKPSAAPMPSLEGGALTGQGDWIYQTVLNWGKIPGQEYIGSTHGGVAVDKSGHIYVSTDGPNGVIVYEPDGTFIRSWGEPSRSFHSLAIREEGGKEYLYAAGHSRVCKLDLDGKIVLQINSKPGSDDLGWTDATAMDAAPDGTIFVADGYGTNLIYKYAQDGKFLGKFGARGTEPGQFKTCHGLTVDTRNPERPLLIVCDRENLRIQLLDFNGNVINIPITGLRRPCVATIRGDLMLVAELAGRAVILDKDYKILSVLGDNPVMAQRAKFKVPPQDWKEGVFTAPHGCAIDYNGDLYIQDWNQWGRITKLVKTPAKK
ncbi:MAG: 6-bladed beta-propeller [Verrucomicrobiota bacterium]